MKTWSVQYLCEWQNSFRLFFPLCLVLHRLRVEGLKDPVALLLYLLGIHLHEVHSKPLLALFSGSGTGLLPLYQRWKYRKVERISCTGFHALDSTGKYFKSLTIRLLLCFLLFDLTVAVPYMSMCSFQHSCYGQLPCEQLG